jgi:hypothetical protein
MVETIYGFLTRALVTRITDMRYVVAVCVCIDLRAYWLTR